MEERRRFILNQAVEEFGVEKQTDLAIEEMGELIVAINHYRRGRCQIDAVQEEVADVRIAMDQLAMIYGEKEVPAIEAKKLDRLKERVVNHIKIRESYERVREKRSNRPEKGC